MALIHAVNLDPADRRRAEVSARLAQRLGVPMRLLHVCEDPRAFILLGTEHEHVLGSPREDLERLAADLKDTTQTDVHTQLTAGPVERSLIAVTELSDVHCLVIGPGKRNRSVVAERIAQFSRIPVILIRDPERMEAWLSGQQTLRILVCSDAGRAAEGARRFAAWFATAGPSQTTIVHADTTGDPSVRRRLLRNVPDGETDANVKVISGPGRPESILSAFAETGSFDLLVAGARDHHRTLITWPDSIARALLRQSSTNVVLVPFDDSEPDNVCSDMERVVVGVDFSERDHRIILHSMALAGADSVIHLVHVVDTRGVIVNTKPARRDALYRLQRLTEQLRADSDTSFEMHVVEGKPEEQLPGMARQLGADVMVVGSPTRRLLSRGGVVHELLANGQTPVLIIPLRHP